MSLPSEDLQQPAAAAAAAAAAAEEPLDEFEQGEEGSGCGGRGRGRGRGRERERDGDVDGVDGDGDCDEDCDGYGGVDMLWKAIVTPPTDNQLQRPFSKQASTPRAGIGGDEHMMLTRCEVRREEDEEEDRLDMMRLGVRDP